MIHAFIDTNILIDLIADRKPFSKFAIQIFQQAESGAIKLYASSHSLATTHYLLKKYVGEKLLRETLSELLNFIEIIPIDVAIIKKSLNSGYKDFEDAILIHAACSVAKIGVIITRNIKDFKGAPIEVAAPDIFCDKL